MPSCRGGSEALEEFNTRGVRISEGGGRNFFKSTLFLLYEPIKLKFKLAVLNFSQSCESELFLICS